MLAKEGSGDVLLADEGSGNAGFPVEGSGEVDGSGESSGVEYIEKSKVRIFLVLIKILSSK